MRKKLGKQKNCKKTSTPKKQVIKTRFLNEEVLRVTSMNNECGARVAPIPVHITNPMMRCFFVREKSSGARRPQNPPGTIGMVDVPSRKMRPIVHCQNQSFIALV